VGEGYTCKATALEPFYQMGSSRCGNTASPWVHALRLHGCSLTLSGTPRCRCACITLTALIEDGRANRENIHVTFVDLPLTDYSEAGLTVADQKRNP